MPNADTLQRLASLHRRAQAHTIAVSYRLCTMMSYITPGAETRVVGRERGAGGGTGNASQPCLSVCLSVSVSSMIYLETHVQTSPIIVHITYDCSSVLL